MKNAGCLKCLKQKNQYSWSGGALNVPNEIFPGSYLTIVEVLENPWWAERYPKEQVLQCDQCNAVWHIEYAFPDRPPLHVSAKVIPDTELASFFTEIGTRLSKAYENPE